MANINDNCVGCQACLGYDTTKTIFAMSEGKAHVVKEPETDEEKKNYEAAKKGCPVGAIE